MLDVHTAALTTKYLSATGLGVLLYDHSLTFPSEVSLVWRSPPSFSKYLLLFNRYLVPMGILLNAYQMNVTSFTNQECRIILPILVVIALVSLGIAEFLVLLRVVVLWDRDPHVAGWMILGFIISFASTVILMILACVKLIGIIHACYSSTINDDLFSGYIEFLPGLSICVITKTSPLLVAAWIFPVLFECIVLISTACNVLSQPRTTEMPLTRALHRDGIFSFLALGLLRLLNLSFAATYRPELTLLVLFFVWPMTSVIVNRSLFRIRRAKILNDKMQRDSPLMENIDASSRPGSPEGHQPKGRGDCAA